EAARTVLDLETRLAAPQWTRVQNRDPEATYNKVALDDLVEAHPNLLIETVFAEAEVEGVDSVIVRQPPYLDALDGLMASVPLEDWVTWAQARTLSAAAPALSQDFVDAHFGFYGRTLDGREADRPRWKKGISAVNGYLGESVGRIYVGRHFTPAARERMERMILHLREAMRQSITELDWMGEETKEQALEKLGTYVFKIGYPDEWEDYSALEVRPDDLYGNIRRGNRWQYDDMIGKLGRPVDRGEWQMN